MQKPPTFGEVRFSCPHCGALAHQYWATTRYREVQKDWTPTNNGNGGKSSMPKALGDFLAREYGKKVSLHTDEDNHKTQLIRNLHSSRCGSCDDISIWLQEKLVYPPTGPVGLANPDMPEQVKSLYDEAGAVFQTSPRAAAALLRLALQHLLNELTGKTQKIDTAINELIDRGLDTELSKIMHSIRIIGNEAVHPGTIDVNDDPSVAKIMFELLNQIVDQIISRPKKYDGLWATLPENKRKPVEEKLAKRDEK